MACYLVEWNIHASFLSRQNESSPSQMTSRTDNRKKHRRYLKLRKKALQWPIGMIYNEVEANALQQWQFELHNIFGLLFQLICELNYIDVVLFNFCG
jgi:hypothetical protein